MSNHRAATALAATAYDLWQEGSLEDAALKYAEALRIAPCDAPARADCHGEFAAVLEELGRLDEARQQLEAALALEITRAGDALDVSVVIARYFLAEFLLRHGQAQRALDEVSPHLGGAVHGQWLLYLIAAEAWVALGDTTAAEQAARSALLAAPGDDKRTELRLRFLALGLHDDGP